ncbi:MAG TPA: tetratricopeptide repeat protein, partial [Streptosporangiaceae bacterium]|nr:tetratricopeptide repeat protein [Streptosporangiaceae bacterium]
ALAYAQQAEDLMTANPGNEITQALVLQLLGKVHEHLGRLDEAASSLRRAIAISQSCGFRICAAECHHRLGVVLTQLGQPAAAEQSLRVAVDLYRTLKLTAEAAQAAEYLNDLTRAGSLSDQDQRTVMPTLA